MELWRIVLLLMALGLLVVITAPIFGWTTGKVLGK